MLHYSLYIQLISASKFNMRQKYNTHKLALFPLRIFWTDILIDKADIWIVQNRVVVANVNKQTFNKTMKVSLQKNQHIEV